MAFEGQRRAALAAVQAAARLTQAVRASARPDTLQKGDRSPVTLADYGSQAVVCRILEKHFSSDAVIAEEDAAALRKEDHAELLDRVTGFVQAECPEADPAEVLRWIDRGNGSGSSSGRYWTLDPIDGTKGFLRGDQYAVALALIEDGYPVVAALACPALREEGIVLTAVRGEGCTIHGVSSDGSGRASVSLASEPSAARLSESVEGGHSSHSDSALIAEVLGITEPPRRLDSQAKYAVVALGEADIYMRLPVRPGYTERIWDHAAGTLVVEEAGGRVSDVHGKRLNFGFGALLRENTGVVATNGKLHELVLAALATQGIGA